MPSERRVLTLEQLARNRLVTIEVIYRLPDYRRILQSFIWQTPDVVPGLPRIARFIAFWEKEIEGPIHSMRVIQAVPFDPEGLRHLASERYLFLH